MAESFKPIAVRPPNENRIFFFVRCCFDLQMLTIFRFLKDELKNCRGRILDVGAGEGPWRKMFPDTVTYVGVDVVASDDFGMNKQPGMIYYDGVRLPFADGSFEHVRLTEVLEHVSTPHNLLRDIHRILTPGGSIILTVPWSARVHHAPFDYFRFSNFGLKMVLEDSGFSVHVIKARGNDIAVVANKLIVMIMRLLRPGRRSQLIITLPLVFFFGFFAITFLIAAQITLYKSLGNQEDPLGYGVIAVKG